MELAPHHLQTVLHLRYRVHCEEIESDFTQTQGVVPCKLSLGEDRDGKTIDERGYVAGVKRGAAEQER
jgi:hypothetical protein